MRKCLLILFLGLMTSSFGMHKFYVSISTINHSRDGQKLECSIKLFKDDLEKAIENSYNEKLVLPLGESEGLGDSLINSYTNQFFKLNENNDKLDRVYIGSQVELDVVWIFIEYQMPKNYFELDNTCLMEMFDSQVNIVHYKSGDEVQSEMYQLSEHKFRFTVH